MLHRHQITHVTHEENKRTPNDPVSPAIAGKGKPNFAPPTALRNAKNGVNPDFTLASKVKNYISFLFKKSRSSSPSNKHVGAKLLYTDLTLEDVRASPPSALPSPLQPHRKPIHPGSIKTVEPPSLNCLDHKIPVSGLSPRGPPFRNRTGFQGHFPNPLGNGMPNRHLINDARLPRDVNTTRRQHGSPRTGLEGVVGYPQRFHSPALIEPPSKTNQIPASHNAVTRDATELIISRSHPDPSHDRSGMNPTSPRQRRQLAINVEKINTKVKQSIHYVSERLSPRQRSENHRGTASSEESFACVLATKVSRWHRTEERFLTMDKTSKGHGRSSIIAKAVQERSAKAAPQIKAVKMNSKSADSQVQSVLCRSCGVRNAESTLGWLCEHCQELYWRGRLQQQSRLVKIATGTRTKDKDTKTTRENLVCQDFHPPVPPPKRNSYIPRLRRSPFTTALSIENACLSAKQFQAQPRKPSVEQIFFRLEGVDVEERPPSGCETIHVTWYPDGERREQRCIGVSEENIAGFF